MSQRLIQTLLPIAAITLLCPVIASVYAHEAPILQHKLNRLYFGLGTESAIYAGCSFVVECDTDTVATGTIEQALPGMSYSQPLDNRTLPHPLDSCRAFLEPAAVDSNATITIAAPDLLHILKTSVITRGSDTTGTSSLELTTDYGGRIVIADTVPFIDLPTSLQFDMIDAFLSYRDHSRIVPDMRVMTSPAPCVAVLVPNLSQPVNREALLTTSMYYRYSAERLSLVFPGDRVIPLNCLLLDSATCPRPYPYDPQRGRQLLSRIDPSVRDVRLGVADISLQRTGLLFVDVLARDRISATLLTDPSLVEIDAAIVWITAPLGDIVTPLQSIYSRLDAMNSGVAAHNEALDLVGRYLEAAADAPDRDGRIAYARLAAQRLSADLGVFALFRPRLYFHSHSNIVDFRFDTSGQPDFKATKRLVLPAGSHATQGGSHP